MQRILILTDFTIWYFHLTDKYRICSSLIITFQIQSSEADITRFTAFTVVYSLATIKSRLEMRD